MPRCVALDGRGERGMGRGQGIGDRGVKQLLHPRPLSGEAGGFDSGLISPVGIAGAQIIANHSCALTPGLYREPGPGEQAVHDPVIG